MKLIAFGIILTLASMQYVETASSAAVGLFAPDRYEGIPEMCLMPMDFGYCKAKVKRFYFDMRRMKCNTFYWGGCAGNINNFKSLEECNKVCLEAFEGSNEQSSNEAAAAPTYRNFNSRNSAAVKTVVKNTNENTNTNFGPGFKNYKPNKSHNTQFNSTTSTTTTAASDDYEDN